MDHDLARRYIDKLPVIQSRGSGQRFMRAKKPDGQLTHSSLPAPSEIFFGRGPDSGRCRPHRSTSSAASVGARVRRSSSGFESQQMAAITYADTYFVRPITSMMSHCTFTN